ncbi:hypothetical protein E2P60_02890 [Candidatus Bathyarchaeota archaeon]|nr:hypothetical protein E2P60_02890 [Candidatus Bathyarchaeota archaeon]
MINKKIKHAEDLAERIGSLNGLLTNKFESVNAGVTLEEMLRAYEKVEKELVAFYKWAIQVGGKEGDFATKRLLEDIFTDEEKTSTNS